MAKMQFGVLLPHFGKETSPSRIIDGSKLCEELGFHSVWVRDHLIWQPHGMEKSALTFVEPFVTLSAVAAVTKKILLGMAVLVPVRWPLKVSQDLASLSYIAGGRVIAGMGLGFNPAELATVGMRIEDRVDILRETIEIARLIWKEDNVSYKGKVFSFENVTLEPKPVEPIPIFCGGSTRAAIRRAAAYCDGWIPGRVPMATFDDRIGYLRQLTDRKITLGQHPDHAYRQGPEQGAGEHQRRGARRELGRREPLDQAAFGKVSDDRGPGRPLDRRQPGRLRRRDREISQARRRTPGVRSETSIRPL